ncbi:MAG: ATP-binding protein [Saprospiraceae bacterium]|nr:ATP-binding protein [Saprospiraceae bacterium]
MHLYYLLTIFRLIVLLLSFGFCLGNASDQNHPLLDSLQREARNATTDSARVYFLDQLAASQIRYGISQAEETLTISSEEVITRKHSVFTTKRAKKVYNIVGKELANIFEAFKQAGENTHLQHGGTGLGLAISKQLVELQGGRIEVDSPPGQVSEFRVFLPVGLTDLPEPLKPTVEGSIQKLPSRKILLVEDNQFNQLLATELLQHLVENPQITIAENGFEAIDRMSIGRIPDIGSLEK